MNGLSSSARPVVPSRRALVRGEARTKARVPWPAVQACGRAGRSAGLCGPVTREGVQAKFDHGAGHGAGHVPSHPPSQTRTARLWFSSDPSRGLGPPRAGPAPPRAQGPAGRRRFHFRVRARAPAFDALPWRRVRTQDLWRVHVDHGQSRSSHGQVTAKSRWDHVVMEALSRTH